MEIEYGRSPDLFISWERSSPRKVPTEDLSLVAKHLGTALHMPIDRFNLPRAAS